MPPAAEPSSPDSPPHPTFRETLGVWLKIGLLSFGGPTGQIALMHRELVEKRRWIGDGRFLHALNYCMLLPGPEAQQLSVYVGWLLHRVWGGVAAGVLFVLPGALLLWGLSWLYVAHGQTPWLAAAFYGLKPAVVGIVAAAVLRIGKKALKRPAHWAVAAAAFVGIWFLKAPFPVIVFGAALVGLFGERFAPAHFSASAGHAAGKTNASAAPSLIDDHDAPPEHGRPTFGGSARTFVVCVALWLAPLLLLVAWLGREHVLVREGVFFSKAALVTFGGAYAVLPYVAQQAVEHHAWLTAPQMLDGLGLAETTPGPLILVLQYVGFLGAWSEAAPFSPLTAATLGAGITLWCTFVPSFLFVFLGAPWIEAMRGRRLLGGALTAITAAVVGVILNLALWFALGVFFPAGAGLDVFALVVALAVFVGLWRFNWSVVPVVLACAALGAAWMKFWQF